MIRERDALFRQVRHFFFHPSMIELYRIENVKVAKPLPVERKPGQQREAGKFRDLLECRFGPFELTVMGPFESARYPMGLARVVLGKDEASIEGPLDAMTWDVLAKFVKQHQPKEDDHGHGSTGARGSDTGRGGGDVIPGWGSR